MENETSAPGPLQEGIFFSFDWTKPTFETVVGFRFTLRTGQEELANKLLNDPTLAKIGMMLAELAEATGKRIPVQVVYVDGPKT